MTNESPVYIRVIVAVYPCVKDVVAPGFSRIKVIIALKIVHYDVVCNRKAPHSARTYSSIGVILINSPVVSLAPFNTFRWGITGV